MSKLPYDYDEPDDVPGISPVGVRGCGALIAVLAMAVLAGAGMLVYSLLTSNEARAQNTGMMVFLEGEEMLPSGFKLCHYSMGVTITVPGHRLCPISIRAP